MRGDDKTTMGTDTEKSKHNPDSDNLKSLLKKTGKKDKKPNRVVFNETKNEFFDADYIILIREECDFDDEDDESICTCYQHEMVKLTCCEPNCNCSIYDEFESQTPQSPKFAPPIEFVDAVTLSPPEGYKDMELEEQELLAFKREMARRGHQRAAVCKECKECSATENEYECENGDDTRLTNSEENVITVGGMESENEGDKEKIDQSQQTTPTSPNTEEQQYLVDLENDRREELPLSLPTADSPVSGILKGGKLWRQQSAENNALKQLTEQLTKTDSTSDDEGSTHRMVRFIENEEKKDSCKSSPEIDREVEGTDTESKSIEESPQEKSNSYDTPDGAEPTEMTLTFKLGNHVLISNNSLKPNSAVRQLFPCTKPLNAKAADEEQYVVTAESLRAFEEAKRSKLPQIIQNVGGTNESIKRVIERNTLRRSLLRYEPKNKKIAQKTDNSLVERIKQLTCDIDADSVDGGGEDLSTSARMSPTGEEMQSAIESNQMNKYKERNFSPSSSSTASSSSSSMSSTYKKITDLFSKREKLDNNHHQQNVNPVYETKTVQIQTLPDLGGPYHHDGLEKSNSNSKQQLPENRKQFLSTLAPLSACVSNINHPPDDHYYHLSNQGSLTSSTGSDSYTLDDIDEALQNGEDKKITPDVLAGTPASESGDELANFVQQDANRIERIKKKYENDQSKRDKTDEDDEHDDYGFNRRPSVRGIKPRFSSTTEILQEIQNQIQLPTPNANLSWPYYSETNPSIREEAVVKPAYPPPYPQPPDDAKSRGYPAQYRPESLYQNYGNQSCYKEIYKTHSSFIEIDYSDYQSIPKMRNGRPISPPPQEMSKTYNQTMVYIPYNHIDGYQPFVNVNTFQANDYCRYNNQNQINKKYIDPYYQQQQQQKLPPNHQDNQYCNSNVVPVSHKLITQKPYPNSYQPLLVTSSRSESPLGNFSIARSTQTSVACMASCNYYPASGQQQQQQQQFRYRDSIRQPFKTDYVAKQVNRHSFPTVRPVRYPPDSEIYLEDPDQPPNGGQMYNGYYPYMPAKESPVNSPTKAKFIERGVPEGAASVSPQDSINLTTTNSTTTSPTTPHTVTSAGGKPLFYAMNV